MSKITMAVALVVVLQVEAALVVALVGALAAHTGVHPAMALLAIVATAAVTAAQVTMAAKVALEIREMRSRLDAPVKARTGAASAPREAGGVATVRQADTDAGLRARTEQLEEDLRRSRAAL